MSLAANALWWALSAADAAAFRRASADPGGAQEKLLMDCLRRNEGCEYGRRFDFRTIRSASEYAGRVPVTSYEDYQPAVERIGRGEKNVLTSEDVQLLEPTGGSTGGGKLIPSTKSLRREFNRAVGVWIRDLFSSAPGAAAGKAYWSVTPAATIDPPPGCTLPVGFYDDSEYLGRISRRLLSSVRAVPPEVGRAGEMAVFRYMTLFFLLKARDLALISVWSPTFLSLLAGDLPLRGRSLADDVERGIPSPPGDMPALLRKICRERLGPDPRRAAEIRDAMDGCSSPAQLHSALWPGLRVISCWADGGSRTYARDLEALFPAARIQPKGLIATEGFVSIPLDGCDGAALALTSHFFEFIPEGGGDPVLAGDLERGKSYSVLLTTGGGFYRYRLNDLVEVTGRRGGCPLLRFVGRESFLSDRFGEKLEERQVRTIVEEALAEFGIEASFAMAACEKTVSPPAYRLFLEAGDRDGEILAALGRRIEEMLCRSFHYRYCRDLGQLGAAGVVMVGPEAGGRYLERCAAEGKRLGDIKPVALHPGEGWRATFA